MKTDRINYSNNPETDNKGLWLLREAEQLFRDRYKFFKDRERAFRYLFGDQWSDTIKDPATGKTITEEAFIREDGRLPIVNNLIGKTVRNLIGQFRQNYPDAAVFSRTRDNAKAGETMTSTLQAVIDKNQAKSILDPRQFEEFLMSAAFGWKTQYKWWSETDNEDVFIQNIDQTRFFYNMDSQDPRNIDVTACGEVLDMDFDDVVKAFAETPDDIERLKNKFPYVSGFNEFSRKPEYMKRYRDFYNPDNENKVRVIEYWKKEREWLEFVHDTADATFTSKVEDFFLKEGLSIEEIQRYSVQDLISYVNEIRKLNALNQGVPEEAVKLLNYKPRYEDVWKVYYLTPLGHILFETYTPYDHQGNPYDFGLYPLIDGRTMSLVVSIIDQQRFVNRIIQMIDKGLSQSIQNLMWVPKQLVPKGMDLSEFSNQSFEHNGMIFYDQVQGVDLPKVISTNANVVGQFEILQIMQGYLENISSVNDAIQGREPNANTPASLYAQRVNNAAIGNKDYFDTFFAVIRRRNRKIVQLVKQYYEDPRYVRVAGSGFDSGVEGFYDPDEVKGIDFDVVIGETQDTLAYRQTVDTYLMQFLENQFITFQEFLQTTSLPFADTLLEKIKNRANDPQSLQGLPPELMEAIQGQMSSLQAQN